MWDRRQAKDPWLDLDPLPASLLKHTVIEVGAWKWILRGSRSWVLESYTAARMRLITQPLQSQSSFFGVIISDKITNECSCKESCCGDVVRVLCHCLCGLVNSMIWQYGPTNPDQLTGRVMKEYRGELSFVYSHLFQMLVDAHYVPRAWKSIVPVPKNIRTTGLKWLPSSSLNVCCDEESWENGVRLCSQWAARQTWPTVICI